MTRLELLTVLLSTSFTAFKRWLLWDHKERYAELLQFCGLQTAETDDGNLYPVFYRAK